MLIGILGAIGASRFFDNTVFEGRAYADQVKSIIRYAQKLAIARNQPVFVRSGPAGFAVCFQSDCGVAAALAPSPGGGNSGGSAAKAYCTLNNVYVANWTCEARPSGNMVVASAVPRAEFSAGNGFFYFDNMGRPYNSNDALGGSNFGRMVLNFTSGASSYQLVIEPETGYVH